MDHYFVLTGAPGSGKTTVLNALGRLGVAVVAEPARQILAEQRSVGGEGVPDRDPALFTQLLLSRALYEYRRHGEPERPLLFDRGLPDVIGYCRLFGVPSGSAEAAARRYRYNRTVFLAPALEEIYRCDDERTMDFAAARGFGHVIREAYEECGYDIIELPAGNPASRARFILEQILHRVSHQATEEKGRLPEPPFPSRQD